MADLLTATDESTALEDLHTRGFTDGLPVIIPTPARVSRMVLASGLEADMVLGAMGPGHGIATIEKEIKEKSDELSKLDQEISSAREPIDEIVIQIQPIEEKKKTIEKKEQKTECYY